jgi:hypothetical protein
MQHQQTRNATQSVSQTQSLAAVQTLLRAGLGAITFLRSSIILLRDIPENSEIILKEPVAGR